jgi:hypothetical protein
VCLRVYLHLTRERVFYVHLRRNSAVGVLICEARDKQIYANETFSYERVSLLRKSSHGTRGNSPIHQRRRSSNATQTHLHTQYTHSLYVCMHACTCVCTFKCECLRAHRNKHTRSNKLHTLTQLFFFFSGLRLV